MDSRVLFALRSFGADVDRLPEIPRQLADHIAALTPGDIERIKGDVRELELPRALADPAPNRGLAAPSHR